MENIAKKNDCEFTDQELKQVTRNLRTEALADMMGLKATSSRDCSEE